MLTGTLLDTFLNDFDLSSFTVTFWLNYHASFLFFRFFKLHERKCEPVVMTVPRKVSPFFHLLNYLSCAGEMAAFFFSLNFSVNLLSGNCSVLPLSRTCFRTTCTLTQPDLTLPWRLRNGLMAKTESPSTSPSRMAMYRERTVN